MDVLGIHGVVVAALGLLERKLGFLHAAGHVGAVDGVEHIALVDSVTYLEVSGQDGTFDHGFDGVGVGGGDGAVGAVAVDDVPLFGSRLDILGAGGSGFCTVLRDKHGCGHRCRTDGGSDGLPVLFDKGLHARRSRLGRGRVKTDEIFRIDLVLWFLF